MSAVVRSLVRASALLVIAQGGWEANPRLVQLETARQKGVFNYEESRVGSVELPALLAAAKGRVRDPKAWAARRTEIRELFREHVYGRSPGKPDKTAFEVRFADFADTLWK